VPKMKSRGPSLPIETKSSTLSGNKRDRENWVASTDTAVFIQKTYDMISRCDQTIACWSDSGDVFIVKDHNKLAKIFIPRYFDHNNFSSFARQLNFYGFRKINSFHENNLGNPNNHVKFFHEAFQRDHPELLCNIKRSTLNNSGTRIVSKEIEVLKKTVSTLEDTIDKMSADFEDTIAKMTTDFEDKFVKLLDLVRLALKQNGTEPPPKRLKELIPITHEDNNNVINNFRDLPEKTEFARQQSVQSTTTIDFIDKIMSDEILNNATEGHDLTPISYGDDGHLLYPDRTSSASTPLPAALKQIPLPEMGIIRFLSDLSTGRADKDKKVESDAKMEH